MALDEVVLEGAQHQRRDGTQASWPGTGCPDTKRGTWHQSMPLKTSPGSEDRIRSNLIERFAWCRAHEAWPLPLHPSMTAEGVDALREPRTARKTPLAEL